MLHILLCVLLYFNEGLCLWSKGIVHYAISSKDYDLHSQDIITSALSDIQKEVCIKFFNTPPHFAATVDNKILYINNPEKRKTCPPDTYNYTGSVVDMPVGYKCMTTRDVTRIVVDMLRASIEQTPAVPVNSYDLIRKFQEQEEDPTSATLLSPTDRNFINAHYHTECGALLAEGGARIAQARRFEYDGVRMSTENEAYYENLLWPLGVVMYGVDRRILQFEENNERLKKLKQAMAILEQDSCIVFQEVEEDEVLRARSLLWFAEQGLEAPRLGFMEGNQTISLTSMTEGAPGHIAHILNQLMRTLGMPMTSNRHDRDYYVNVNWNNIQKGKEHYMEKTPRAAWLLDSEHGYDFDSVTHAPANYMCRDCSQGATTIEPTQDHLWQRTLSMGRRAQLSTSDKERLMVFYQRPCQDRYRAHLR